MQVPSQHQSTYRLCQAWWNYMFDNAKVLIKDGRIHYFLIPATKPFVVDTFPKYCYTTALIQHTLPLLRVWDIHFICKSSLRHILDSLSGHMIMSATYVGAKGSQHKPSQQPCIRKDSWERHRSVLWCFFSCTAKGKAICSTCSKVVPHSSNTANVIFDVECGKKHNIVLKGKRLESSIPSYLSIDSKRIMF